MICYGIFSVRNYAGLHELQSALWIVRPPKILCRDPLMNPVHSINLRLMSLGRTINIDRSSCTKGVFACQLVGVLDPWCNRTGSQPKGIFAESLDLKPEEVEVSCTLP